MKKPLALAAALAVSPAFAHAHGLPGAAGGFAPGFAHPLLGLDHLLAMLAVGLWAGQLGGRARWALPLTFVGVMALGGALGMTGHPLPLVEPGITVSVLLLGLLIAFAVRLPLIATLPLIAAFALLHGSAHGTEMPATASGLAYATGFLASTAALHLAGLGLGLSLNALATSAAVRAAGAAVVLAGAFLAVA